MCIAVRATGDRAVQYRSNDDRSQTSSDSVDALGGRRYRRRRRRRRGVRNRLATNFAAVPAAVAR